MTDLKYDNKQDKTERYLRSDLQLLRDNVNGKPIEISHSCEA